jgi:hypothetical protein
MQLSNLEVATASLLRIALELPQGVLRDQLVDRANSFDSIADVMRVVLDPESCKRGHSLPAAQNHPPDG